MNMVQKLSIGEQCAHDHRDSSIPVLCCFAFQPKKNGSRGRNPSIKSTQHFPGLGASDHIDQEAKWILEYMSKRNRSLKKPDVEGSSFRIPLYGCDNCPWRVL